MAIPPEKQTLALNSLHDISEYTTYLDRRILKLNLLYQSLDMAKKKKSIQDHNRSHNNESKFYSTAKQSFQYTRKPTPTVLQSFYVTDYQHRRKRNKNLPINGRGYSDIKSELNTFDRSQQVSSAFKSRNHPPSKKNQEKLKLYQTVKKEMLGTFYVGGGKSLEPKKTRYPPLRHSLGDDFSRTRKGKLWHGRPPIKIVQKYQ